MKTISNSGKILSLRGSVVDVEFKENLPPILTLLHAANEKISIEVLTHLDSQSVRGIALTTTQGLSRGDEVKDTGGPLKVPVGREILSRMFDVYGNTIDLQKDLENMKSELINLGVLFSLLVVGIGLWLDRNYPAGPSCTLGTLIGGLSLGCFNAWHWISKQHQNIQEEVDDD